MLKISDTLVDKNTSREVSVLALVVSEFPVSADEKSPMGRWEEHRANGQVS